MIPEFGPRQDPPPTDSSYPFAFATGFRPILRLVTVRPDNSAVHVDGLNLTVRFGPWHLTTTLDNVVEAQITGPFAAWKVCGPRLSLADRGLTFGTNADQGVCISFRRPVAGIEPTGLLRHPSLTVTVADPAALLTRLMRAARPDLPDRP